MLIFNFKPEFEALNELILARLHKLHQKITFINEIKVTLNSKNLNRKFVEEIVLTIFNETLSFQVRLSSGSAKICLI